MSTTIYTEAGLQTDDPLIAAMFLGKDIEDVAYKGYVITAINQDWVTLENPETGEKNARTIPYVIPWPTVAAAIEPREGGAVFEWWDHRDEHEYPEYYSGADALGAFIDGDGRHFSVAVNPITTGKTVGELRELLAKANPKNEAEARRE